MRYRWDDDDSAWLADVSPAGPAGAISISIGPARIEFDRIDFGRITRLVVYADCADDERARVLGAAGALLGIPREDARDDVEAEMTGTPVWEARYDLAKAAQLIADLECLVTQCRQMAAGLAAAEFAVILHRLGDLAPSPAVDALEDAAQHVGGNPFEIQASAAGMVTGIAEALSAWMPGRFDALLRALREPLELAPVPPPPVAAEKVYAGPDFSAGRIEWSGTTGVFSLGLREGTGQIRRDRLGVVHVEAPAPQEGEHLWALLWDDGKLVSGGPLVPDGSVVTGWLGPVDGSPTYAEVIAHPFRDAGIGPMAQLTRGVRRARLALALEPDAAASAAECWWNSASDWLGVNELGRAAIAYDRCAEAHARAGRSLYAVRARERAQAFASPWALPSLGGHSGVPYRPAWELADPAAARACHAEFPPT
jgi:hypothetical protein